MTRNRWEDDPAAIAEAERFYSFVGQYVISFQWLEMIYLEIFECLR